MEGGVGHCISGRGIGECLESVRWRSSALSKPEVSEIRHCFGDGRKIRRGLGPSHGEGKGQSDQGGFMRLIGDGYCQFWNIGETEPDAVKSVGDVQFDKVHWAMARIAVHNLVQQPVEGATKLHGLRGR